MKFLEHPRIVFVRNSQEILRFSTKIGSRPDPFPESGPGPAFASGSAPGPAAAPDLVPTARTRRGSSLARKS